jgi:hypothetical protein
MGAGGLVAIENSAIPLEPEQRIGHVSGITDSPPQSSALKHYECHKKRFRHMEVKIQSFFYLPPSITSGLP